MLKLLVFLALAMAIAAAPYAMEDIPGVSPENMERLRQIMDPRPRIEQWENSLPESERAAAIAHREQILEKHYAEFLRRYIPGVSKASMDRLRQALNPRPEGPGDFAQRINEWMSSLPPEEKIRYHTTNFFYPTVCNSAFQAAVEAQREQMHQKRGPPPSPPF